MAQNDAEWREEVDEYLWPLTGAPWAIDWQSLAEEMQIRQRLGEIMAHVQCLHVEPRLRQLGVRPSADRISAVKQSVMVGPENGPAWTQRFKEPVPRALREQWNELSQRLRTLIDQRSRPAGRSAPRNTRTHS
jgi:hypothetical protein